MIFAKVGYNRRMSFFKKLFGRSEERPSLTEGSISRNVLALALPGVGAMVFQTSFSLIDLFWVGKLGKNAIAAVSISAFIIWMLAMEK